MEGRFRSLNFNLVENFFKLAPNSIEDPQKRFSPKFEGVLSPDSIEEQKKRSSPQFRAVLGRNLGFIGADSHFFV